jgi:Tfp pilus assembly protein PilN
VIAINLLANGPAESRTARPFPMAATWLVVTCVALTGYGCYLHQSKTMLLARLLAIEAELAEVTSSATNLDQARKRQTELVTTLAALGRILEDRRTSMELFEAISRSMPDGLWLTEVKRSATTVQLDGRASTLSAIAALARRLGENLSFVHSPEIRSVSTEGAEGSQILHFQVAGELALAGDQGRQ